MFTAMALIRLELSRVALAQRCLTGAAAVVDALHRALDLELAIMLESYRDDYVARIQRIDRLEREQVGRTLARTDIATNTLSSCARVLFVGLDAEARVCLYNREAERVTGFGRDEVLGMSFVELLPAELREDHGSVFQRAAAGSASSPTSWTAPWDACGQDP